MFTLYVFVDVHKLLNLTNSLYILQLKVSDKMLDYVIFGLNYKN